nr:hypothetical protein [Chlamydiota bacterium]
VECRLDARRPDILNPPGKGSHWPPQIGVKLRCRHPGPRSASQANPELKAHVFLNRADPRGHDNGDAAEALRESEAFSFIDTPLGSRKAFSNAASQGLAVTELSPKDPKAAQEMGKAEGHPKGGNSGRGAKGSCHGHFAGKAGETAESCSGKEMFSRGKKGLGGILHFSKS